MIVLKGLFKYIYVFLLEKLEKNKVQFSLIETFYPSFIFRKKIVTGISLCTKEQGDSYEHS
jgi:hypothetical protein